MASANRVAKFNVQFRERFADSAFATMWCLFAIRQSAWRFFMDTTDQFLRFAAECEVMAKFTRSPENKAVWNGLAQRWMRCAELMEQEHSSRHHPPPAKRHRTFVHNMAH
jgi:hypothetical protein